MKDITSIKQLENIALQRRMSSEAVDLVGAVVNAYSEIEENIDNIIDACLDQEIESEPVKELLQGALSSLLRIANIYLYIDDEGVIKNKKEQDPSLKAEISDVASKISFLDQDEVKEDFTETLKDYLESLQNIEYADEYLEKILAPLDGIERIEVEPVTGYYYPNDGRFEEMEEEPERGYFDLRHEDENPQLEEIEEGTPDFRRSNLQSSPESNAENKQNKKPREIKVSVLSYGLATKVFIFSLLEIRMTGVNNASIPLDGRVVIGQRIKQVAYACLAVSSAILLFKGVSGLRYRLQETKTEKNGKNGKNDKKGPAV